MATPSTPYKPSPLSFNSPRTSPFRRPNSPLTHSPSTARPSTPTSSPLKPKDTTPTRHVSASTQHTVRASNTAAIAARFDPAHVATPPSEKPAPRPVQPVRTGSRSSDALSKIPPPLLHSMRESFSVLDRDNSGSVTSADVADMLSQLGLSATPSTLSAYFNGASSINLATYLSTLSDLLSGLSSPTELNAAFDAFDDADDGQIDLAELKDALLHTAPEPGDRKLTEREIDMVVDGFSGRRALAKGGRSLGRGEVFRYQEFVASVTGGGNGGDNGNGATVQT